MIEYFNSTGFSKDLGSQSLILSLFLSLIISGGLFVTPQVVYCNFERYKAEQEPLQL